MFNGERHISRALDSLLEQDYANLEIIISDNGSTDATPEICREYAHKDPRIKYNRSEKNMGILYNFNRVFELSKGKYFMWAAHDDKRERSFVNACVRKMEQSSGAVLCQVHTASYIEGREELLRVATLDSFANVSGLAGRYRETLKRLPAVALYGLYRSSAMRQTHMLRKSMSTELAFIQELSIYGDFIQVPEVLFTYFGRPKWNTVEQDYSAALGGQNKPWWYLPFFILFCDHFSRIAGARISFLRKFQLWGVLIQDQARQVFLKLLIKSAGSLCPAGSKERVGEAIYWRWLHNPNTRVANDGLFRERIIKPMLGWWR